MAKKTSKKTVSKADAKTIVKVVKAEKAKDASKARVAKQLTQAAVDAGLVKPKVVGRGKRPSIVVKEIVKREGLRPTSHRYEIEAVVDAKGRHFWCVKLDGFYAGDFDSIAEAKKAYPNARILGGEGCAEAVEGMPKADAPAPAPAPKTDETPDERLARLKAAARKAWETRRANGWKHPKAKSEMLQKIDAQLAESRAISKKARETFKAIEEKKAEKAKALAVVKRVEKREADKRKGRQIGGIAQLKKMMGQAIGLN